MQRNIMGMTWSSMFLSRESACSQHKKGGQNTPCAWLLSHPCHTSVTDVSVQIVGLLNRNAPDGEVAESIVPIINTRFFQGRKVYSLSVLTKWVVSLLVMITDSRL